MFLWWILGIIALMALALFGIIPLWAVMISVFLSLAFAFKAGTIVVHRLIMWTAFGNRLKAAYSAKFSGENPAFSEEVDAHIKVMKSLGRGHTKSVHMGKLKRLSAFVEVPFRIPEEDCLPEEEKTRAFDGGESL